MPAVNGVGNIPLLPLLGAASEQDDQRVAIPPKVDTIARTKIDPLLQHALANGLEIGRIAGLQSRQRDVDLRGRDGVETIEPFLERYAAILGLVGDKYAELVTHTTPFVHLP